MTKPIYEIRDYTIESEWFGAYKEWAKDIAAPWLIENLEVIDALAKAAANNRQLQFNYRKPAATEAELRVVDPYHLANVNG